MKQIGDGARTATRMLDTEWLNGDLTQFFTMHGLRLGNAIPYLPFTVPLLKSITGGTNCSNCPITHFHKMSYNEVALYITHKLLWNILQYRKAQKIIR